MRLRNGRDEGVNLELVYEDANGAQVAETLYLRYFDLKDLENGQTRFLNAPLSAIEGFCLVDIEENRSQLQQTGGV